MDKYLKLEPLTVYSHYTPGEPLPSFATGQRAAFQLWLKQTLASMLGVPTALLDAEAPVRSSGDIVRDLMRVREWEATNPIPQAIWLIDREHIYADMEYVLPVLSQYKVIPSSPSLRGFQQYGGMPVYHWSSRDIQQRIAYLVEEEGLDIEDARRIYPFCQPGVWMQMSNGKHKRLMA